MCAHRAHEEKRQDIYYPVSFFKDTYLRLNIGNYLSLII